MSRAPRSSSAKKSWGTDDSKTNILHVDMDAFFVSVELLEHPELRGKPVAVGGRDRGVISAASYEARAFGVNSAMPVAHAKRRCPHLIILPVRHGVYSEVSRRIMKILEDITPLVEQLSVDEAFLDVAGARKMFGSPVEIGEIIRSRIREQEGVPASVGVASTKHVAKIASAHAKPDGLLLIPESATQDFLSALPVGALWGVGEKTREKLSRQGIELVEDLVAMGEGRLRRLLGEAAGSSLYALATGVDPRSVNTTRKEKSMSREQTFFDTIGCEEAAKVLLDQSHDVARRLRRHGYMSWTVGIKVRFSDFSTVTRSATLGSPTDLGAQIYEEVSRLFAQVDIPAGGIRLLGVRAEHLTHGEEGLQLSLGDDGRRSKAELAMDSVRSKFGSDSLGQGSLIGLRKRDEAEGDRNVREDE